MKMLLCAAALTILFGLPVLAQTSLPTATPDSSALGTTSQATGPDSDTQTDKTADPPAEASDSVTMFPHSKELPFWVSGQANVIFQAHPPFHALYSGINSFSNAGEYKTSLLGTMYMGWQVPRTAHTTELLLDLESTGGRGLSQALGLAGFTNLDVVRNPTLSASPYVARVELHQIIPLSHQTEEAERNYLNLATLIPSRLLKIRVGKMSTVDSFDVNSVGSDSHLQFTNWTIDNNGAYDYAADTRGYTYGAILEYQDHVWAARYGLMLMPTVANGIDLDWNLHRAHADNIELELRRGFLPKKAGTIRFLTYINHAHMGSYREAVLAFLEGHDPVPDVTHHEHFGAVKYGFGLNAEQQISAEARLFARFGWNDDQHESFAYTEVGQ